ncbi:MAG: DNA-formamidopyrimidine glycosylase family protein [Microbacteriaceae bacterium]|nr:DNA-formamidopyrimidine glycosylase family protein [Microbacteriaceae bacterium]
MPEGHSVHRIAKQFAANFVGAPVNVSSPQGRFIDGAKLLDGQKMVAATAVGKQMFLQFESELWLQIHLGIYGAWDFSGEIAVHPDIQIHGFTPGHAKIGQTGEHSRTSGAAIAGHGANKATPANAKASRVAGTGAVDEAAEDSVTSIGAPRKARVRMAEQDGSRESSAVWPPEPVGQVRVRLLNERVCADLRGPTVCKTITDEEMAGVLNRLGPDPANNAAESEAVRFIERAHKKATPIGLVLMDQSVIAGIGNVYRAEMLFRAGINPHTPAKSLPREVLRELWDDWVKLLDIGIRVGQMITVDGLTGADYQKALVERDARHWVYKKENTPCGQCGANIILEEFGARKLYWCPECQK